MPYINQAEILGHVGKDPEIRSFPNGGRVANFSIATSEHWKDKATGQDKSRTEWHKISVTNEHLVGIAEKYVKKGSKVLVKGAITTRKWQDKDGKDQYTTEIVLKPFNGELLVLDKREEGEKSEAPAPVTTAATGTDDEIPF